MSSYDEASILKSRQQILNSCFSQISDAQFSITGTFCGEYEQFEAAELEFMKKINSD